MKTKLEKVHLELLKKVAHEVWESYDDKFGYRTEKQKRNAEVSTDDPGNAWFFWNQFDSQNHDKFSRLLLEWPVDEKNTTELFIKVTAMMWVRERMHEELDDLHIKLKEAIENEQTEEKKVDENKIIN